MATDDFFRARLDSMIDMRHPLVVLATRMPWTDIEASLAPLLAHKDRSGRLVQDADLFGPTAQLAGAGLSNAGRPRLPIRLMVALLYLKHAFNLSDEELCERWSENVVWQFFSGLAYYEPRLPCDATQIGRFRRVLGEAGVEQLLKSTIEASVSMGAVKKSEFEMIIVDTTVQEKAIAHPTDSRLLEIARHKVASAAKRCGIALKQTFAKEGRELRRKAGGYAHARQFKRLRRTVKRQRTILGALMRNARRGLESISQGVAGHEPTALAITELMKWLERAERIRTQQRHSKNKLYALHAPEVECIGKGKARKPFLRYLRMIGSQVSLAVTHKLGLMVGARSFPGNPYDGHTLAEQLEQTNTLLQDIGVRPTTAVVDLGFRGVDEACAPVQIIHRGKFKSLDKQQRRWLKRRQAIEPAIGHTKSDNRMDRCWLGGSSGDALHAVLCAAGFNIRWLLRAIATKGLVALLLLFSQVALYAACIGHALQIALRAVGQRDRRFEWRRWRVTPSLATG
ncbi:IS5 family transposase [Methylibium sp.]|uniref:IS5 family transposase n=1 Tax=Methylibium sp. TaxID=2067992 RepID=UPI00286B311B|nr:IS5 family transposase [Methylibium sp.]